MNTRQSLVEKAVRIVEEELGGPIPDYVKFAPESLADIMTLHGEEELRGVAEVMKKEIAYHKLVHEEGVDPEEASHRVYGPIPEVQ